MSDSVKKRKEAKCTGVKKKIKEDAHEDGRKKKEVGSGDKKEPLFYTTPKPRCECKLMGSVAWKGTTKSHLFRLKKKCKKLNCEYKKFSEEDQVHHTKYERI